MSHTCVMCDRKIRTNEEKLPLNEEEAQSVDLNLQIDKTLLAFFD